MVGGIIVESLIIIVSITLGFFFLFLGVGALILPLTPDLLIFDSYFDLAAIFLVLGFVLRYISLLSKPKSKRIPTILKDICLLMAIETSPVILALLFSPSSTNHPVIRLLLFLLSAAGYYYFRIVLDDRSSRNSRRKKSRSIFTKRKYRQLRSVSIGILGIIIIISLITNLIKSVNAKPAFKNQATEEFQILRLVPEEPKTIYDIANKKISPVLLKGNSGDILSKIKTDLMIYDRLVSDDEIESTIRRVQQALKNRGYDAGIVDGIWGPKTQRAIEAFQSDRGFYVTGQLNIAILKELGVMGE